MGKLKLPKINQGKNITAHDDATLKNLSYPIFCFRHLHRDHCLEQCNPDEKVAFVEQLTRLSTQEWQSLQYTGRHGMGTEKIAKSSIKPAIPSSVTDDVEDFLAFRFLGKAPFIGFRNKFIFHIVFIDPKFSVYKH